MDLVTRVKNIMMSPNTEWQVIAAEPADVPSLYRNYIAILAAISPVCSFIGTYLLLHQWGMTFTGGLGAAILSYLLTLGGTYVMALVISKLAPRFGAPENLVGGLKVAAYAATSAWIGGIFLLIPMLGIISLLFSLYSLYLFYVGLPVVMGTPQANTLPYVVTIIICAVVISIVIGAISAAVV